MTREEFLKERILQIDSIRGFAASLDMPYTTLLSILKNVGGASIDNILKICSGLGISADYLATLEDGSRLDDSFDPDLIALQRNYKSLDNASKKELSSYAQYLYTKQGGKMPEDDDID